MDHETVKKMIDEIGPYSASFTGGEVTLVWDQLVKGLKYSKVIIYDTFRTRNRNNCTRFNRVKRSYS